jgi:tetratricopeptide (TPR) repeat protein
MAEGRCKGLTGYIPVTTTSNQDAFKLMSIFCFAAVITLCSAQSSQLIAQGRARHGQGKLDEALSLYDKARKSAMTEGKKPLAMAHYWIAQVLAQKGNALAFKHYQLAIKSDSQHEAAHYSFALALQRSQRIAEAAVMYKEVERLNPANANALINLGICHKNMGR